MNIKIINFFTSKVLFFISLLLTTGVFFLNFLDKSNSSLCRINGYYSSESDCVLFGLILLIFVGILLFSTLFLFFKNTKIFEFWRNFTFIYLCIYVFVVSIFPWEIGDAYLGTQKDIVALFLVALYTGISLILIVYKTLKK